MSGSLYIHVPFCKKKCHYCSFYVIRSRQEGFNLYTDALIAEINQHKKTFNHIESIYFGGGTPTQLPLQNMQRIMNTLDLRGEVTLEANPEDLDQKSLKQYKAMGFNRLSIGAQSFDNSELITLGRGHTHIRTVDTIRWAREAGFDNISIDLMVDLPNQTQESLQKSLNIIKKLDVEHISLYNLQIEQNSLFWAKKNELNLPTQELSLRLYEEAIDTIESIGFERYEISAFCKSGKQSKHNTGYWLGREFIGLGPGAFSYHKKKRYRNVRNLNKWALAVLQDTNAIDFSEELKPQDHTKELLAIALRMTQGIVLDQWNLSQESLAQIENQIKKGWLKQEKGRIKLSKEGLLFYDSVASSLI